MTSPNSAITTIDSYFYADLKGVINPETLSQYGPHLDDTTIRFGRESDQSQHPDTGARALAAVAALALKAPKDASSAGTLDRLARTGVVGATLQSDIMRAGLDAIKVRAGQTAVLWLATTLADPKGNPRLPHALIDFRNTGYQAPITDPTSLTTLSERALSARYSTSGELGQRQALFMSYAELISNKRIPQELRLPPLLGYMSLGEELQEAKIDLGKLISPDTADYAVRLADALPDHSTNDVNPRFAELGLPPYREKITVSGPNSASGDGSGNAQDPANRIGRQRTGNERIETAPKLTIEETWDAIGTALSGFLLCRNNVARVSSGTAELYRQFVPLNPANIKRTTAGVAAFSRLVGDPKGTQQALEGKTSHPASVVVAAAERNGLPVPQVVADKAAAELLALHPQLRHQSIADLPVSVLNDAGIEDTKELNQYQIRVARLPEAPPHLVQLARTVLLNNQNSIMPVGECPQPSRFVRTQKGTVQYQRDLEAWNNRATEANPVIESLRQYLQARYKCPIPPAPYTGQVVHDVSSCETKLVVLAICDATEQEGSVPDYIDPVTLQKLLARVTKNDVGTAARAYDELHQYANKVAQPKPKFGRFFRP